MKVIKRDGHVVDFCPDKIEAAIEKANASVDEDKRVSPIQIRNIIKYIETRDKKRILVEDIQDIIELKLMTIGKYEVAKKYITYRYRRELVRKSNTTDQTIKELIDGSNEYWNTENSNKNARVVTTQRDYIAGITSTDITKRFLLPQDIVDAHEAGIIHFHDADYFAQNALHNCNLINLEDMLQNGTNINGVMIEKPHRFLTAMTIATQIITCVASSQYGGTTISLTHLAPFVRLSKEYYIKKYQNRGLEPELVTKFANEDLAKEITDGVQTFQYQINSMTTTNGQAPFLSVCIQHDHRQGKPSDRPLLSQLAVPDTVIEMAHHHRNAPQANQSAEGRRQSIKWSHSRSSPSAISSMCSVSSSHHCLMRNFSLSSVSMCKSSSVSRLASSSKIRIRRRRRSKHFSVPTVSRKKRFRTI